MDVKEWGKVEGGGVKLFKPFCLDYKFLYCFGDNRIQMKEFIIFKV